MKKKNIALLLCCLLILTFIRPQNCIAEEIGNQDIEVIIMLDTSGSMNAPIDPDKSDSDLKIKLAKEWAQDLCALFVNTNITVSVCTFDNVNEEEIKIKKIKIDIKNGKENIDKLEEIESKESGYTDHYGAIKKAVEEFGQEADYKYIIILSDGETEYENNTRIDDNKVENDSEKKLTTEEAKKHFCSECKAFASEENQGIFLVGFGQDVEMFKELDRNKEQKEEEQEEQKSNIVYIDQSKEPSEITNQIFGLLNMPLSLQEENKNWNRLDKIEFELDKEHYRTIINITKKSDSSLEDIDETQIKLYMEGKEIGRENFDILNLGNSAFLYLEPSEKGKYEVMLPEDIWNYSIRNLDNRMLKEVKLILQTENVQPEELEDGIIQYDIKKPPKNLVIKLEFVWDGEGEHMNPDRAVLVNTSQKEKTDDDWKKGRELSIDNWNYILDHLPEDNENNIYCARVENGSQVICSNNIKIVRDWTVETKEQQLGENQIYKLINALPEGFKMNEVVFEIENEDEYKKYITRTEDTISFSKAGKYVGNVTYKSEVIGKVAFTVEEKNDSHVWFGILVVIAIAIAFIIMIVLKIRKK